MTMENQTPQNENENNAKPAVGKTKAIVAGVAVAVVAAGGFAVSSSIDAKAEKKVAEFTDKIVAESNGDMNIAYGDVSTSMGSSKLSVSDIHLSEKDKSKAIEIEEVEVQAKGYVDAEKLPYLANVSVKGMQLLDKETLQHLNQSMGVDYANRDIDVFFGYEVEDSKGLVSTKASLSVSGLSEFTLSADISGMTGAWNAIQYAYKENEGEFDFTPAQRKNVSNEMKSGMINSFSVAYDNKGEVEAMIAHMAEEGGVTEDQVKARLPLMVDHYFGNTPEGVVIKEFLQNPENAGIKVSVDPKNPIKFRDLPMLVMSGMMGQTQEVIEALNMTIKSN